MFNWLKKDTKEEDKKLLLEAWKEVVNVQMHFNEIEMKIRSLAVTVITAISGAIGYLLKENIDYQKEFILLLSFVATAAWFCFYLMDRFMYHKLLKGAVYAGLEIEKNLKENGVDVCLGEKIKESSPLKNLFWKKLEIHSDQKLDFFYITVPIICISGILMYLKTNLLYTLVTVIVLSLWGLYALAKGYQKPPTIGDGQKEFSYHWRYYIFFFICNCALMFALANSIK